MNVLIFPLGYVLIYRSVSVSFSVNAPKKVKDAFALIKRENETRMHSSKMRIARSLTVSRSIWGECLPNPNHPGCNPSPPPPPLWTEWQTGVKT